MNLLKYVIFQAQVEDRSIGFFKLMHNMPL